MLSWFRRKQKNIIIIVLANKHIPRIEKVKTLQLPKNFENEDMIDTYKILTYRYVGTYYIRGCSHYYLTQKCLFLTIPTPYTTKPATIHLTLYSGLN